MAIVFFVATASLLLVTLDRAHAIGVVSQVRLHNADRKDGTDTTFGNSNTGDSDCHRISTVVWHGVLTSNHLPKVLILGDSIASADLGYFNATQESMKGVAELISLQTPGVPPHHLNSFDFVKCLPWALASASGSSAPKFDAITFNWGLHDILPEVYGSVSSGSYISNLKKFYWILKDHLKADGKLMWVSTSPVPPDSWSDRRNADVVTLNKLANALWINYPDVTLMDLYSRVVEYCLDQEPNHCYPERCPCSIHLFQEGHHDVHPSKSGRTIMAKAIGRALKSTLGVSV